jgi:hypothetical protein
MASPGTLATTSANASQRSAKTQLYTTGTITPVDVNVDLKSAVLSQLTASNMQLTTTRHTVSADARLLKTLALTVISGTTSCANSPRSLKSAIVGNLGTSRRTSAALPRSPAPLENILMSTMANATASNRNVHLTTLGTMSTASASATLRIALTPLWKSMARPRQTKISGTLPLAAASCRRETAHQASTSILTQVSATARQLTVSLTVTSQVKKKFGTAIPANASANIKSLPLMILSSTLIHLSATSSANHATACTTTCTGTPLSAIASARTRNAPMTSNGCPEIVLASASSPMMIAMPLSSSIRQLVHADFASLFHAPRMSSGTPTFALASAFQNAVEMDSPGTSPAAPARKTHQKDHLVYFNAQDHWS